MERGKNGQFLVRESQNFKGDYTLCVLYEHKVEHYRVRRNKKNFVTVDDEEYFENLFKLVEVRKNGCTLEILVVVLVVCC